MGKNGKSPIFNFLMNNRNVRILLSVLEAADKNVWGWNTYGRPLTSAAGLVWMPDCMGAQMEGECLCFCCGVRLALDRDDLQRPGPTSVHRTTMHAAHVEAEAKMKQMEEEGHDISTCIENLRPTCASCNGDMRTFNLFSFIDVVGGFMKAEMEKWTRRFRSL